MGLFGGLKDFAGALLGGDKSGDATTKTEPWAGIQPYLTYGYKQAQDLYQSGGPDFYPNATYTPFTSQQELAMQMMEGRALQGNPLLDQAQSYASGVMGNQPDMSMALSMGNLMAFGGAGVSPISMSDIGQIRAPQYSQQYNAGTMKAQPINPQFAAQSIGAQHIRPGVEAQSIRGPQVDASGYGVTGAAQNQLQKTATGGYISANPYLDQTYDKASGAVTRQFNNAVMPSVNATFGMAGRTGSGAHIGAVDNATNELGNQLQNLATDVYGQNYQTERDRQLTATSQLGGFQLQGQGMGQNSQLANQQAQLQARQANQQADLTAQGMNLDTRQANQQAALQAAQANQNAGLAANNQNLQAMQANQQNAYNVGATNQQNRYNAAALNQQGAFNNIENQMQARQANQSMGYNVANLNQQGAIQNASTQQNAINALMAYGNAQTGFANQMAQFAPDLAQSDYYDLNQLMNVGNMVQGQAGNVLNDSMNRYNFYQNRPETNMNNYTAWMSGIPGAEFGTTDRNQKGNGFTDTLGGFFGNLLSGGGNGFQ